MKSVRGAEEKPSRFIVDDIGQVDFFAFLHGATTTQKVAFLHVRPPFRDWPIPASLFLLSSAPLNSVQHRDIFPGPVFVFSVFQFDFDKIIRQAGDNLADLMQDNVFDPNLLFGIKGFSQGFVFFVPHDRTPFCCGCGFRSRFVFSCPH
jgi:hypothetical protein